MNELTSNFLSKGFILEKEIGRGAFSTVYRCRRVYTKEKLAAKVVEFGADFKLKWETENEIEILGLLQHHYHIVRLNCVIREDIRIICLLEYIPGCTFIDGILNWPRFNETDVKTVMKQLLKALSFCHSKRIIHRDLSPDNLMFENVPSEEHPRNTAVIKLFDFNLSRLIPDGRTFIHADPYGNPSYMAPETMSDKPIACVKSDIWSSGVILFLLLGGYPPFWNDNYNHLLENIQEANYTLPFHLWSHVPSTEVDALKSLLQQDHNKRPSADQMLSCEWLQSRSAPLPSTWPSQERLRAFLCNLDRRKQEKSHRLYKLQLVKREAYIPDSALLTRPKDAAGKKRCHGNSTFDQNNNIVSCHW